MARKTFFSFHFQNDVWRVNVVRNSWVTKEKEIAGFIDAAEFEKIEKQGDAAIKRWIDNQLSGSSVTVVLIGAETNQRDYVKYELQQSFKKGNGLLGIYIHNIKNQEGKTSAKGSNHFGEIGVDAKGNPVYFSASIRCYDWIDDNGYNNIGKWIEDAAALAGR
jgi:hypothetical protein